MAQDQQGGAGHAGSSGMVHNIVSAVTNALTGGHAGDIGTNENEITCPFCAESIKAEAIVCRHCGRDITIPKPLIEANKALIEKVGALEGEVATLKSQLKRAKVVIEGEGEAVIIKPIAPEPPPAPPGLVRYVISYFTIPLLLLLGAHYLMIMKYDVNPLYLRAASILLPLPFGMALYRRTAPRFLPSILVGIVVGLTAVAGMNTVVGLIDDVSIIPETFRDWRESAEYSLSIALAFLLGALLAQSFKLLRAKVDEHMDHERMAGIVGKLATWVANHTGVGGRKTIQERIAAIEQLVNSGMTAATAAGSIFAGVKAFL